MGGRRVKSENARAWQGPWDRLPEEEVVRRQSHIKNLKLPPMFETAVERNKVIARVLGEGVPASAIARAFGISKDRVYKIASKMRKSRGRFVPRKRKVVDERIIPVESIINAVRYVNGPASWLAIAQVMHRESGDAVYDALRRRGTSHQFRAVQRLLRLRRRKPMLLRKEYARRFRELRERLGRPVTSRDLCRANGLTLAQVQIAYGKGGRYMTRLAIDAGLDPLESRRDHFSTIAWRRPRDT
jgi:hypothetical protein